MPPPAPDPTMQTSYTFAWLTVVDPSDGARLDGVPQRAERVARGHELVRDKSSEPRVGDGRGDRVPVQLLRAVQLVAAGDASRVKMGDVIPVVADGADDVAFHDLHVIDVVQQLDARRANRRHDGHAERRAVALIIRMVDLAVQELEADGDALFFRERLDGWSPATQVAIAAPSVLPRRLPNIAITFGT